MSYFFMSYESDVCFYLVYYTSIYENSESKVFQSITFSGEISNNWLKSLLGTNVYKTLEFC